MNPCHFCRRDGLVFMRYTEAPGTFGIAACTCEKGLWWRLKHNLRALAARYQPQPVEIGRLEEFYTADELKTLATVEGLDPSQIAPHAAGRS